MTEDERVVKSVWSSAHAVEGLPGHFTIRRFSPFNKNKVEGRGTTAADAWKNAADKIRQIWREDDN